MFRPELGESDGREADRWLAAHDAAKRAEWEAESFECPNCLIDVTPPTTDRENRDPRERAEYIAASRAEAAMADWRPATEPKEAP